MEKYEDTQAGADSMHSRKQGIASPRKEGKDHPEAKKKDMAKKMHVSAKVKPWPRHKGLERFRKLPDVPSGTSGWDS